MPKADVILVCLLGTARLSAQTSLRQRVWMQKVQERLSAICGFLVDMKAIKILTLGRNILHRATDLRQVEVDASQGYRTLLMWSLFIGMTSPKRQAHFELRSLIRSGCMPQFMSSALTFAVFAIISAATNDRSLMVAQAFTSLSLISLLTQPLNQLVQASPQLLACSACFTRIEEFLELPEKDGVSEMKSEQSRSDETQTFSHEESEKDKREKQNGEIDVGLSTIAVSIREASFGWSPSFSPVLHNINLEIRKHSIEVLCGPIGSGKSTLIHGILGNARRITGSLQVAPETSSYCGQVPWLMSGTIRDNILAGSAFDNDWYKYTLWACSLDIDLLQGGDLTDVGSNGNALSGGQKQRVVSLLPLHIRIHLELTTSQALARLVYSRSRMAFCDDIFSGLDATTEYNIANRIFGPDGYMRKHNVTVLLATHSSNS